MHLEGGCLCGWETRLAPREETDPCPRACRLLNLSSHFYDVVEVRPPFPCVSLVSELAVRSELFAAILFLFMLPLLFVPRCHVQRRCVGLLVTLLVLLACSVTLLLALISMLTGSQKGVWHCTVD